MAEWVIGKLLDRQAQIERVKAQAAAMQAELENDLRSIAYRFGTSLEEWTRLGLERRKRSVKTFAGTVGFRDVPGRIKITDPDAVRRWALEQEDPEEFGAYGYALRPKDVLDHVRATGEDVPGVERSPDRESFYIEGGDVRVDVKRLMAPKALPSASARNDEEEP